MSLTPLSGRDLAQIRWGEALRRQKRRRRRWRIRVGATAVFVALMTGSILIDPAPRLLWNASASAPVGLYHVAVGVPVRRGDLVVARLAPAVTRLAAERQYLAMGVPVVKRIAAMPGDTICSAGPAILINGIPVADRLFADRSGRRLGGWSGCHRLGHDRYLLINEQVRASFDGRYFGPSRGADIIGTVTPLWLR